LRREYGSNIVNAGAPDSDGDSARRPVGVETLGVSGVPFADVRDVSLFFTDEGGDGTPMVFIHGFSCDSHDWSWQIPHFAANGRVIAFDLRGHGRSSAPAAGYDLPSITADVAALVDHLGCGPVVAVGHSLGGAIAALLAVERRDLVHAVVAIDPGHLLPDDSAPYLAAALAAYDDQDPGEVAGRFFDAASHTAATPPALARWHNRRALGTPAPVLRQTIAGLIGGPRPFALASNSAPVLRECERPVLSFYVNQERRSAAQAVFRHPDSRTVCFEGAGHWLHQEQPDDVNAVIDQWLGSLEHSKGERR
jgi:pimeloyl-ACP methyl ester carboxylesterase